MSYITLLATIIAPLIAVVISIFYEKYFMNKPKLIVYYGYIAAHSLSNPVNLIVHTHSIVVKNIGKLPTHNVRIGHVTLPEYTVNPPTNFKINEIPGGGREIMLPILVPNEEITISYLYFPPLTFQNINTYVKSDDGLARIIKVIPTPNLTGWKKYLLYTLLFLGSSTAIFLIIMFIICLYALITHCKILS